MMDCCIQVRAEKFVISFTRLRRSYIFIPVQEFRKPDAGIEGDPDTGYILGDDRRLGGSGHSPVKDRHKDEIRTIFRQADTARKRSGTTELPMERSREAKSYRGRCQSFPQK